MKVSAPPLPQRAPARPHHRASAPQRLGQPFPRARAAFFGTSARPHNQASAAVAPIASQAARAHEANRGCKGGLIRLGQAPCQPGRGQEALPADTTGRPRAGRRQRRPSPRRTARCARQCNQMHIQVTAYYQPFVHIIYIFRLHIECLRAEYSHESHVPRPTKCPGVHKIHCTSISNSRSAVCPGDLCIKAMGAGTCCCAVLVGNSPSVPCSHHRQLS